MKLFFEKRIGFIAVAVIIVFNFFALTPVVSAAINPEIDYQGKLANSSGVAVSNGNYNIEFKLYTVASGGSAIWTEDDYNSASAGVSITNGLFSVMLGSTTALTGVNFNQTLYLGVNIGATSTGAVTLDGEMTPRKIIGTVPAAFVANTLQGYNALEFMRSDAANATSTSATYFSVTNTGSGDVADFVGTASSTGLFIQSSGNVGIGSTTPGTSLVVVGTTTVGSIISTSTTNYNTFAGFVGIGTTTPWQALTVSGNFALTGSLYDSTASAGLNGYVLQSTGTASKWVATSSLGFASATTTAALTSSLTSNYLSKWNGSAFANSLIYDNGTNVGIGSSSPSSPLVVVGNILAGYFTATSTTATSTLPLLTVSGSNGLTLSNLTGTQCLHEVSGLVSGTGSDCGSGGGGTNYWSFSGSNLYPATTTSYITADHFVASSTTATSAFAGALTIGTTTLSSTFPLLVQGAGIMDQATGSAPLIISNRQDFSAAVGMVGGGSAAIPAGIVRYAGLRLTFQSVPYSTMITGGTTGSVNVASLFTSGQMELGTLITAPSGQLTITQFNSASTTDLLDINSNGGTNLLNVDYQGDLGVKSGSFTLGTGANEMIQNYNWIQMPTDTYSGIGTGAAGTNPWIAYAPESGDWFNDANPGDVAYRNQIGNDILIGIDSGAGATSMMNFTRNTTGNPRIIVDGAPDNGIDALEILGTTTDYGQLNANNVVASSTTSASTFAGKVGIGTTTPTSTLTVVGSLCVSKGSGATLNCGTTAGDAYGTVFNTGAYDLAEDYTTSDPSVTAGTVVALNPNNAISVIKATEGSVILGIVSTNPGVILGGADITSANSSSTVPIALAGRVPVQVSMQNGPIAIGDSLTISSMAGVAMKATDPSQPVIATALEAASRNGSIMAFVRSSMTSGISLGTSMPTEELGRTDDSLASEFGNLLSGSETWLMGKLTAVNGFFDNLFTAHLTVGSSSRPSGITLYDQVTGQPYCLAMVNGQMASTAGVCVTGLVSNSQTSQSNTQVGSQTPTSQTSTSTSVSTLTSTSTETVTDDTSTSTDVTISDPSSATSTSALAPATSTPTSPTSTSPTEDSTSTSTPAFSSSSSGSVSSDNSSGESSDVTSSSSSTSSVASSDTASSGDTSSVSAGSSDSSLSNSSAASNQ